MRATALVLALALTGCLQTDSPTTEVAEAPPPAQPPRAVVLDLPEPELEAQKPPRAPLPRVKPAQPEPSQQEPSEDVVIADSETAALQPQPAELICLEPTQTVAVLGEPSLRLQDPPAQVWQYNATECTLRLHFYRDIITQQFRALSYEIENTDTENVDAERRCLNDIISGRRAQS